MIIIMNDPRAKGFIEELQSLEEPTKKKILVVSTVLVMAVVVYVWLGYFNNLVSSTPGIALSDNSSTTSSAPGFFERVTGGSAFMLQAFGSWTREMGSAIESPRQYDIKPR